MKLAKLIPIHRLVGIVGFIWLILCILNHLIVFPSILKKKIKKEIALKNGGSMRKTWSQLQFSYETHFYVFNTTNHKEIANGAKPVVKEIGPYIYDVWQEKVNLEDHEEDDSLSYSLRRIHKFNQLKSNGLSDEKDLVILPDHLRVSAGSGFHRYNPAYVFASSKGIDIIYDTPDSIFVKEPVKTFLFDGLYIPCRGHTNYFAKVLCNEFGQHPLKYSLRGENGIFYTSVWGHFNDTFERERKLRIHRGIENIKEVGQVLEYEEKTDFDTWNNDSRCNTFHGTDGTILRPFLSKDGKDTIEIVNTVVCRSLIYTYDSTVEYSEKQQMLVPALLQKTLFTGLKLLRYTSDIGADVDNSPDEKCFCTHPDRCVFKKGILDLLWCTYVPWVGSNPHFYLADQIYIDAVDGVNPDKEKHMMFIDVDPLTGIIVRSHMRVQFNMELLSLKKYRLMKTYPTAILPMVWVDEIIILPDFLIREIRDKHKMMLLEYTVLYLFMILAFIMCGVAGFYEYKLWRNKKNLPKIVVASANNKDVNNSETSFAKASIRSSPVATNLN